MLSPVRLTRGTIKHPQWPPSHQVQWFPAGVHATRPHSQFSTSLAYNEQNAELMRPALYAAIHRKRASKGVKGLRELETGSSRPAWCTLVQDHPTVSISHLSMLRLSPPVQINWSDSNSLVVKIYTKLETKK